MLDAHEQHELESALQQQRKDNGGLAMERERIIASYERLEIEMVMARVRWFRWRLVASLAFVAIAVLLVWVLMGW